MPLVFIAITAACIVVKSYSAPPRRKPQHRLLRSAASPRWIPRWPATTGAHSVSAPNARPQDSCVLCTRAARPGSAAVSARSVDRMVHHSHVVVQPRPGAPQLHAGRGTGRRSEDTSRTTARAESCAPARRGTLRWHRAPAHRAPGGEPARAGLARVGYAQRTRAPRRAGALAHPRAPAHRPARRRLHTKAYVGARGRPPGTVRSSVDLDAALAAAAPVRY
jgi:hypothetical protein